MYCQTCGLPLESGVTTCPNCGSVLSSLDARGNQPYAPTQLAKSQPAQQPTHYGSNPYYVPPPPSYIANPYENGQQTPYPSPYQTPYYVPQPPPRPTSKKKPYLIIGGILAAILVLCVAPFFMFNTFKSIGSGLEKKGATATATVEQQATPTEAESDQELYPPKNATLILSDPMHDNSKGYKWDEATMSGKTGDAVCGFKANAYHIEKVAKGSLICDPEATQLILPNIVVEARLTVIKGSEAGLVARFDQVNGTGYLFDVITDGSYVIDTINFNDPDITKHYKTLHSGTNTAIKQGLQQSNLLALLINGQSISVFVNGQFLDTIQDASLPKSGQLGLYGHGDDGLDVVARNVRAWRL